MKAFWQGLGTAAKVTLVAGVLLIVGGTIAVAVWLLRTDYAVLFGNVAAQDAAAMTAELDRMKVPYKLDGDGTTILVDRAHLHETRLKLMSKDLPLNGAVGFELFNNTDFGMTEFAQKVNYQRALQGEITRTIMSLAEVESVRVHLAFPEEGLFKRDQGKGKAAITLALRHGQTLRPEQVKGIQRLVAASVSGISPQDVTIVDQTGVALSRVAASGDPAAEVGPQLELKREIEQHLNQKASQVLDRAFGPGRALASVDVVLDMNQVRRTTEDVLAPPVRPGEVATGVVVRERESTKDDALQATTRDGSKLGGSSSQRETEYQVGRRVEQVVSQPGSIRSLQVLAVIRAPLDAQQIEQARSLISAAVGASAQRGDVVVVQPMNGMSMPSSSQAASEPFKASDAPGATGGWAPSTDASPAAARQPAETSRIVIAFAVLLGLVALLALFVVLRRPRADARALNERERQLALAKMREWLAVDAPLPPAPAGGER